MTVSNLTNRLAYPGTGAQFVFPYTFKIFVDSDLSVVLTASTGIDTTKTLNVDYTVSGAGVTAGGNVTMVVAPAIGETLTIKREIPLTQEADFVDNDPFPAVTQENALDRLTMIAQQMSRDIGDLPVNAAGIVWKGEWTTAAYFVNDMVSKNGNSYLCILAHTNHAPPNGTYWEMVAQAGATGVAGSLPISAAGGVADAITAVFSVPFPVLVDKIQCRVVAGAANATTTPTFAPDGLAAKTIIKGSNQALVVADIPGAYYPMDLEFNSSLDKWVYLNPAYPVSELPSIVVQNVNFQTGAVATGSTVMPYDDTIPQKTEGDEYMTLAITPTSATNKLLIQVVLNINHSLTTAHYHIMALFKDADASALATVFMTAASQVYMTQLVLNYYMTAGSISEITFKVRAGCDAAGTTTINGVGGTRYLGGVLISSINITEIKA